MSRQESYFHSYNDLSVHELMLKDRARTLAYRNFLQENREMIKDKVVMDVGAGTGILSLFAATAGAKKVYAIEASDVADLCKEIVEENELSDIITVIKGRVEDITLPSEDQKVDIIISEWMGFYLLHESMLDSVIFARDRFLHPDGIMVPSHASIYLAPVNMSDHFSDRAEEWSNIYGFDFSPMASWMNLTEVSEPLIKCLDAKQLCSKGQEVEGFNLKTVTLQDVKTLSKYLRFPMSEELMVHGFAAWFTTTFSVNASNYCPLHVCGDKSEIPLPHSNCMQINETGDAGEKSSKQPESNSRNSVVSESLKNCTTTEKSVNSSSNNGSEESSKITIEKKSNSTDIVLDTSPFSTPTHWKQTVIFLPQTILVEKDINLCCNFRMSQSSSNKRHYNISLELTDQHDDMMNEAGPEQNVDAEVDEGSESEAESDVSTDHPVPCSCGSDRCRLIAALVEKYDAEHDELECEAEMVEVSAEVEAAKQLDADIETGGWSVDPDGSGLSTDGHQDDHS